LRPGEAFYLATQGGARALGKGDIIGTLDAGKEADLVLVDVSSLVPYRQEAAALDEFSPEDVIALCIYRGGPHATVETFVRGKSVYRAPSRS
jgi:guanine deaminase